MFFCTHRHTQLVEPIQKLSYACINILIVVTLTPVLHAPVVERFDSFLSLPLAQSGGVGESEESRCKFDQPFWVDRSSLSHVLLGSEHQFMVDDPEGRCHDYKMWKVY